MLAAAPPGVVRLPPHTSCVRRRAPCTPGLAAPSRRPPPPRARRPHPAPPADAAAATLSPLSFPALAHPDVAHFLNLTNGLEAAPLLRALALPYTLVRLPSTLCEQQRFDALVAGADSALLAAAALGRTCIVWDFGSRGQACRGGPPRAIWYGLEFLGYAAHRKWFPPRGEKERGETQGEEGSGSGSATAAAAAVAAAAAPWPPPPPPRGAFLRGHDVTHVFEAALRGGRGWGTAGAESAAAAAGGVGDPRWTVPGFDPSTSGVSKASIKRLRYFRRFVPEQADPVTHIRLWGAHKPTLRDSDVDWHVGLARGECGPPGGGGRGGGAAGAGVSAPATPAAAALGSRTAPDGRVCVEALAAELASLGFGLFTGGVPHAPCGVPAAAEAARAKGVGGG